MASPNDPLAKQIQYAFNKGLDRVFTGIRGGSAANDYDLLYAEVRRIYPISWERLPTAALESAVKRAIPLMEDGLQEMTNIALTWTQLALIAGGYADPDARTRGFKPRLAYARSNLPLTVTPSGEPCTTASMHGSYEKLGRLIPAGCVDPNPFNRERGRLWDKLASALRKVPAQEIQQVSGDQRDDLVERVDLEDRVRTALRSNNLVLLWGESGNGKSVLAETVAARFKPERVALLRGADTEQSQFRQDVIRALKRHHQSVATWSLDARRYELTALLSTAGSFDLVVLDDVPTETLSQLLDQPPAVPVLVTSRTRIELPDAIPIHVLEFREEEALLAARRLLPEAATTDLERLCSRLGNRPILIDLCGSLVRGKANVDQLLTQLAAQLPTTIAAAATLNRGSDRFADATTRTTFLQVYEEVTRSLSRDQAALAVLDTVLWVTGSNWRETCAIITSQLNPDLSELTVEAGLATLERQSILTNADGFVSANDMTLDLLRITMSARAAPVIRRLFDRLAVQPHKLTRHQEHGKPAFYSIDSSFTEDLSGYTSVPKLYFRLLAEQFHWQRYGFEQVLGDHAGVLQLPSGLHLLWQTDRAVFRSLEGDTSLALANLVEDALTVLSGDTWKSAGEEFLGTFFDLTNVALSLSTEVYRSHVMRYREPSRPVLEFWCRPTPSPYTHKPMSAISDITADLNKLPIWSQCGELYVPGYVTRDSVKADECPSCSKQLSDNSDGDMPIDWALRSLADLMHGHAANDEVRVRVLSARLARAHQHTEFVAVANECTDAYAHALAQNAPFSRLFYCTILARIAAVSLNHGFPDSSDHALKALLSYTKMKDSSQVCAADRFVILDELSDSLTSINDSAAQRFRTLGQEYAQIALRELGLQVQDGFRSDREGFTRAAKKLIRRVRGRQRHQVGAGTDVCGPSTRILQPGQ